MKIEKLRVMILVSEKNPDLSLGSIQTSTRGVDFILTLIVFRVSDFALMKGTWVHVHAVSLSQTMM